MPAVRLCSLRAVILPRLLMTIFGKDGRGTWLLGRHIDNSNTHGTGCSLSSALASELALGHTLPEAAQLAKDYVALGIEHGLPVGHGHGPIHHFVSLYEKAGIGK